MINVKDIAKEMAIEWREDNYWSQLDYYEMDESLEKLLLQFLERVGAER